ncbi:hypothetical protein MMC29_002181 [Sticta canariensis]|nr:hypothetical protein [Sticta canariensis]
MEFKKLPEGVVAASAVRSPGRSNGERAPQAETPAPRTPLDDFEASRPGRRARSPRIFEEKAFSGGNKRKRTAYEDGPFTVSPRPSKTRAMRDIFVVPAAPGPPASPDFLTKRATRAAFRAASSPTPTLGKRKRAGNDHEALAKRRTTSRAASTTHLLTAASEASGAASAALSVSFPPPATETSLPSITASAAPPPSIPETGATKNANSLAAGSTSAVESTSVITRFAYPGSAPLFFLPGFSTPLFSAVAPTPTPAPMLAAPPAPTRTLLPSPVFTDPIIPVPPGMESSSATGPRMACPVDLLLNNIHIHEDDDETV